MGFKIPGPKAAQLGSFKERCEAWVDAFARDDEEACGRFRKEIRDQPDCLQRRLALAYVDKKAKLGVKPKLEPEPFMPTPEETMRVAVFCSGARSIGQPSTGTSVLCPRSCAGILISTSIAGDRQKVANELGTAARVPL